MFLCEVSFLFFVWGPYVLPDSLLPVSSSLSRPAETVLPTPAAVAGVLRVLRRSLTAVFPASLTVQEREGFVGQYQ